jgi:hypothetical protein
MPRVSAAFFFTGVVCVLIGMSYGMYMGAREDFTLAAAHAHLNLVGWVTMALYGTFYALTQDTVMIPALAMFLSHANNPEYVPIMVTGEVLTLAGMALFAVSVLRELLRQRKG